MRKIVVLSLIIGCSSNLPQENIIRKVEFKEITLPELVITPDKCPSEMSWIHGNACGKVKQNCKRFLDPPDSRFEPRCAKYEPTVCIGPKKFMNFCMDIEEAADDSGMPIAPITWANAKKSCEAEGKRLCTDPEWTFACEGEEALPYSTGLIRPSDICNMDIVTNTVCGHELCDHRNNIKENPNCLSPFKIHNMSGNDDEWIIVPPYRHSKNLELILQSSLKGGYWLPVRNRCRPRTDDHDENIHQQISIGYRCCKDSIN